MRNIQRIILVPPLLTDLENLLENISEPVHEASPHTPSYRVYMVFVVGRCVSMMCLQL
jgi:hypothetical protein